MNRNILKPATTFKHSSLRKKLIIENVNDCLYRLNSIIDQTNKNNKCKAEYRLPISFAIPETINEADFRLELYYHIVTILESKGFIVNIKDGFKILVVSWEIEPVNDRNKWMEKLQSVKI